MSQSTWNASAALDRARSTDAAIDLAIPVAWQYVIAFVLLSVFRLGGLTHQSLWFDEGYTLHLVSAASFAEFIRIFGAYTTSEHLQPLYYFIMYGWSRMAGDSDLALRLPSAMFSIASGLCFFAMLRETVSRSLRAYAMVGVGLFSVGSYSVFYAQEARPYACIQFCSFLFMLAWLLQARQQYSAGKGAPTLTIFFAGASVLACLSGIFGALLVFSVAAADLYRMKDERAAWWTSWKASVTACFLAGAAYATFAVHRFPSLVANDIVALKQPLWMNVAYTIFGVLFGTTLGPSTTDLHGPHKLATLAHALPVLIPAGIVVAALLWVAVRFASTFALPFYAKVSGLAAVIYSLLLFGCFGSIGKLNVLPRHASALFAACVLTGAACAFSRSRDTRTARSVLLWSLGAVFVLNAISLSRSIYASSCRKDDYRSVAGALSQENSPIYLTAGMPLLLKHYGLNVHSAVDVEPTDLPQYLKTASGSEKQIVVLENTFRNYRWDNGPTVEAALAPSYTCSLQGEMAFFRVLGCTLRDAAPEGVNP